MTGETSSIRPAPAVLRAGAVLAELAGDGPNTLTLSDLARRLRLPKSSLASVCAALVETGLVRRSPAGYALGSQIVQLGGAYLAGSSVIQRFQETCLELPTVSNETVQFAILDGIDVLYLARHDGPQAIRLTSQIGTRLGASHTALGKATLALLDDAEVADRHAGAVLRTPTPHSHATVEALLADLRRIRAEGYAVDHEESSEGVVCFGVTAPSLTFGTSPAGVSATLLKARVTPAHRKAILADLHVLAGSLGDPLRASAAPPPVRVPAEPPAAPRGPAGPARSPVRR